MSSPTNHGEQPVSAAVSPPLSPAAQTTSSTNEAATPTQTTPAATPTTTDDPSSVNTPSAGSEASTVEAEVKVVDTRPPFLARIPERKIRINFRSTGNAPILRTSKFSVPANQPFAGIAEALRKQLRFKPTDSLFLFVNSSFAPSPDELLWDIYQCFQIDNELVVNYSTVDAYG